MRLSKKEKDFLVALIGCLVLFAVFAAMMPWARAEEDGSTTTTWITEGNRMRAVNCSHGGGTTACW